MNTTVAVYLKKKKTTIDSLSCSPLFEKNNNNLQTAYMVTLKLFEASSLNYNHIRTFKESTH